MKNLSPRLECVASLVRPGKKLADIGTDHAYLPVHLVSGGVTPFAIAADLRKGPLENAKQAVEAAGLEEKIELRLSDGLINFSPDEADEIVIAGMGGILIAGIIDAAQWLQKGNKHLVLQPMTHPEILRKFLITNGYRIICEKVCEDSGKLYCAMSVEFCGEYIKHPAFYEYYGEIPLCKTELSQKYLSALAFRLSRDADSMRCAEPDRADLFYKVSDKINSIIEG